jgi:uncharacterized protein (TIGR00255 family)
VIYSMTGVGTGRADSPRGAVDVELRSVNSRFLDISCRLPHGWGKLESMVSDAVRHGLSRGRVTATVRWVPASGSRGIEVEPEAVKAAWQLLQEMRESVELEEEPGLNHLLQLEKYWAPAAEPAPQMTELLQTALSGALESLLTYRRREADALLTDMRDRLDSIAGTVEHLRGEEPARTARAQEQMRQRVRTLLEDADTGKLDDARLHSELALLAQRLDTTEEFVRLAAHVEHFEALLRGDSPVGRKLEFLIQEIHRECTTVGAKAADAGVSQAVVEMKAQLEKLREQVANLE